MLPTSRCRSGWLLLVAMLLLAACQSAGVAPSETITSPTSKSTPTPENTAAVMVTPTTKAIVENNTSTQATATSTIEPTTTPAPRVEPEPADASLPDPSLFDVAWDARDPFRIGLISAAQNVVEDLPGASVYHMDLEIAEDYHTVIGQQEVRYTNQEEVSLDEIYFRLFPNLLGGNLTVSSLMINGEPAEEVLELKESALRVPLVEPLHPGEQVVIGLDFTVEVPGGAEGNYGSFVFRNDVLALAHFYPMIAVYDDEGWNVEIPAESGDIVYADSSFYLVRITAPSESVVVGSGVATEEANREGEQVLVLTAGPMRDFYIVASERYEAVSETAGETTINSYAFPEHMDVAAETLETAVSSLEIFNERIGPYPFSEFDLAPTPNLALGIEYPGIVVITDRLYDPSGFGSDVPASALLESTVAHEAAHQWFYSVVGNDQLDEPWVDEALVQYVTYLYFLDKYGPADAHDFYQSFVGRWERVNNEDIPVGLPVAEYSPSEYGAIVYGRGPLFFYNLAEEISQPTFDEFLQAYYRENQFDIGTGEEIKRLAEAACECDLTPMWEEWVYAK